MINSMRNIDPDKMYSVREMADIISVSRATIIRAIVTGDLPAHKFGRLYRIEGQSFIDYMDNHVVEER
jgi:excisionase family DNA binding protein